MSKNRSEQQEAIKQWALSTLGEDSFFNISERGLRVLEEAIELAQACLVDQAAAHRLVDYVYSRPVGEPPQEIAGVLVTMYALAAALNVDTDSAFRDEYRRINKPEVIEKVRRRQREKREI